MTITGIHLPTGIHQLLDMIIPITLLLRSIIGTKGMHRHLLKIFTTVVGESMVHLTEKVPMVHQEVGDTGREIGIPLKYLITEMTIEIEEGAMVTEDEDGVMGIINTI